MNEALVIALRNLLAESRKARELLGPRHQERIDLSVAIGAAEQALDDHDQQQLKDARNRAQLRDLSHQVRAAGGVDREAVAAAAKRRSA